MARYYEVSANADTDCPRTGSKLACKTAENQVGFLCLQLTGLIMDEAAEIPAGDHHLIVKADAQE